MSLQKDLCEINENDNCAVNKIRLLCITMPREDISYAEQVEQACLGGADMIQFRDKSLDKKSLLKISRELQEICRSFEVPFTLNDDPEIAKEAGCDGVHVGQTDMSYEKARNLMPFGVIGVSAQRIEEAIAISKTDADYIGLGPVFATPNKKGPHPLGLENIKTISQKIQTPIIAIGGIDLTNVKAVIQAGAQGVAVIRAVCGAKDIKEEARKIKEAILEAERK